MKNNSHLDSTNILLENGHHDIQVTTFINTIFMSFTYLLLRSVTGILDIYTWFFENRASNKRLSLTPIGNLMTILTGNV